MNDQLIIMIITWVWPPHSNSDHQDYYIFNRESQPKPSFTTVTVRGPHPNCTTLAGWCYSLFQYNLFLQYTTQKSNMNTKKMHWKKIYNCIYTYPLKYGYLGIGIYFRFRVCIFIYIYIIIFCSIGIVGSYRVLIKGLQFQTTPQKHQAKSLWISPGDPLPIPLPYFKGVVRERGSHYWGSLKIPFILLTLFTCCFVSIIIDV